jgi:hypothetical protein
MAAPIIDEFGRYSGIIRARRPAVATPLDAETADAVQVERGLIWRGGMGGDSPGGDVERLIELTASGQIAVVAVIDHHGHRRAVYRPLMVYCWLQAYRERFEQMSQGDFGRWDGALRTWCDGLEQMLGGADLPDDGLPASGGSASAEAAWTALALHVAGKLFVRDAWIDLAADAFGRITRGQQPEGGLLRFGASDNPEPYWYHELAILHALASYAVQAEDRAVAAAVRRATLYHQERSQPDHATTQPWALFAFIWNPQTRPLADALLHGVSVHHPRGVSGVPLMLLRDALYCLSLYL